MVEGAIWLSLNSRRIAGEDGPGKCWAIAERLHPDDGDAGRDGDRGDGTKTKCSGSNASDRLACNSRGNFQFAGNVHRIGSDLHGGAIQDKVSELAELLGPQRHAAGKKDEKEPESPKWGAVVESHGKAGETSDERTEFVTTPWWPVEQRNERAAGDARVVSPAQSLHTAEQKSAQQLWLRQHALLLVGEARHCRKASCAPGPPVALPLLPRTRGRKKSTPFLLRCRREIRPSRWLNKNRLPRSVR